MMALSKFLVLLVIFLSASYANALASLSPVAGNKVRDNHLILLKQPMSDFTNKPSCKPICKPTKWMDLDAKLPNNLPSKKTWVEDSKPKQDAELLCHIVSSQPCGLCHNNKPDEVVSFQDQNASQDNHPWPHET
jgi:hypothetical protein